ncbi:MAG: hypothetical protein P8Q29_12340 [Tateyamaria sp.]|nr:hypothetical protein [Tateyamaria sp.]
MTARLPIGRARTRPRGRTVRQSLPAADRARMHARQTIACSAMKVVRALVTPDEAGRRWLVSTLPPNPLRGIAAHDPPQNPDPADCQPHPECGALFGRTGPRLSIG